MVTIIIGAAALVLRISSPQLLAFEALTPLMAVFPGSTTWWQRHATALGLTIGVLVVALVVGLLASPNDLGCAAVTVSHGDAPVSQSKVPARYRKDDRGRYTLRPEWVRAETVISVGLIVLGVYILQAFISTGVHDVAGRIAIVAWVIAIPMLACLALLTQVLGSYRYFSYPWYLTVARSSAQGAALVGFGAAVWRLWFPASLVLVGSSLVALLVFGFAYSRLEQDNPADRN